MDELSEEVTCYELATLSTQRIFRLLSMLMQTLLDLVRLRDRDLNSLRLCKESSCVHDVKPICSGHVQADALQLEQQDS